MNPAPRPHPRHLAPRPARSPGPISKRLVDGEDPLGFEVWPPPRPRGKTKIAHRFVMPTGSEWSGITCTPHPKATPNRLRCELAVSDSFGDQPGNKDVCVHNKRMLPSCATALGGGLLEVYWE